MKSANKLKSIILLTLLLVLTSLIMVACDDVTAGFLSVHMIDVDQGQSILIITPNNKTILIDAGESSEGRKVKTYLIKNQIQKIDLLIATHPHADHIGGLSEIINNFEVEKVIMPKKIHTSATFEKLLSTIEENGLKISSPPIGTTIDFDQDINLNFLGPVKDYGDDLNLWSIVFRLDYKDKSFLFTGDTEKKAEYDLMDTYNKEDIKVNVLNVAHHGSSTSTSERFLEYADPEIALISLGKDNPYGHPHREVITLLNGRNIFVYRTDQQGTVVLFSDGNEIWSNQAPFNEKDNSEKLP